MRLLLAPALALLFAIPASAQQRDVTAADRAAHARMIVIDTHLDTPELFEVPGWDFAQRHRYEWDNSQVDLPRMDAGGLDGGFFVIYTEQGPLTPEGYARARDAALMRAVAIQRVVAANAGRIALATTPDEAERIARSGRHFAFQSIENSWPLGEDLSLLTTFYRLGVRMAGPVHSRTNQFADSATGEARWHGLSPLGRRWVAEMNRLGMIIDASHSSDETFDQMLTLSRTPIILSHSGPRAIFEHRRNLDDARMRRLAEAGGLMMLNSIFMVAHDSSDARDAIHERQKNWGNLNAAQRRQLLADLAALNAQRPYTTADFDLYMRSMLHAIRVMGVDHVGLGADWDGGGGVIGMEDVAALPRISARLRREGLSEADIAKVMGGNLLRVMRQVQAAARP
ncbi:MAG TPA: dipeptidase [Allosphingosinicella sp.]|nr:dipeptidase [Allosphingosinicella sp.]